jgi:hydrogenase maturation protease
VILGVGNILLKDEGIGVHTAHALRKIPLDKGIEVVDGGTSPDIMPLIEGADKLIVIDAALGGEEPGTIYRFSPQDITAESAGLISAHQMSFIENLRTMKGLGIEPEEVVIIGVEPKEVDWGLELSPELQERIPEIVKAVLREAKGRANGFDASPEEGQSL